MNKDPLSVVKMLADIAELEKSREVANSIVRLSAERERLALLEQYLDEYGPGASGLATDIESLRTRRNFLYSLAAAIGDQSASIEQTQAILLRHIETWRSARANARAVNKLTERRSAEKARSRDRIEQNDLDAAVRPIRR